MCVTDCTQQNPVSKRREAKWLFVARVRDLPLSEDEAKIAERCWAQQSIELVVYKASIL